MQEPKQNGIVAYCFGSYMSFMRRQYELMGKRLPRAVTWRAMGYFVVVEAVLVALRFLPLHGGSAISLINFISCTTLFSYLSYLGCGPIQNG